MKNWISCVGFDAAFAALFFLWKSHENEGAGNIVMLVFWISIVVGVLAGLLGDKTFFRDKGDAMKIYDRVSNFAWFLALAYFGHVVTAAMYYLALLFMSVAKKREPKPKISKE